MATLTAWKFPSTSGADAALNTLQDLERRGLIDVHDAVVVSWPEGTSKPTTDRRRGMPGVEEDEEEGSSWDWRSARSTSGR